MANTNDSFEVPLDKLRWRCPPESLTFETAKAINTTFNIIGQERAVQAIKLRLQVRAPGYNIYVGGPPGTGKVTITHSSIDGDSASMAEVGAILSGLAGLPLRQDLAVTGSVNQKTVNEKIEGFFNVCRMKGLTGNQGVLILQQNVQDLMLHQEVIAAMATGKFHIHAISTIDAALEMLTGIPAGVKDSDGKWPEGTVHGKVDQRLRELNKEKKDNKILDEKKEDKADAEKRIVVNPI